MNFRDHEPPLSHARYGDMSKRALNLIFEWMELYKQKLMRDWEKDRAKKSLDSIDPLA